MTTKEINLKTINNESILGRGNITAGGGTADIVTSWESTLSDEKVPSEKLTKETIDTKASISSLSTVATSGSYSDLSNKPSIPSSSSDLSDGSDIVKKSNTSGLIKNDGTIDTTSYSTFSGSYNDLSNKPTILSHSDVYDDIILFADTLRYTLDPSLLILWQDSCTPSTKLSDYTKHNDITATTDSNGIKLVTTSGNNIPFSIPVDLSSTDNFEATFTYTRENSTSTWCLGLADSTTHDLLFGEMLYIHEGWNLININLDNTSAQTIRGLSQYSLGEGSTLKFKRVDGTSYFYINNNLIQSAEYSWEGDANLSMWLRNQFNFSPQTIKNIELKEIV